MTRVAKLNEEMWTELFLENREALVREIDTLVEELAAFAYTIRRGDRGTARFPPSSFAAYPDRG